MDFCEARDKHGLIVSKGTINDGERLVCPNTEQGQRIMTEYYGGYEVVSNE